MLQPPSPEFVALQRVLAGRFSLDRELGRGGMGVVFAARDVALDRPVAIKLLPLELAHVQSVRDRFLREARMAARLSHPHIVPIHAVEEHGDVVFFVMTLVDGETLGARVRRTGPLSAVDAMRVAQEAAWALSHAHAHGVVHRDIKPDNILLEADSGRALVTDFGIAQDIEPGQRPPPGAIEGTPRYMSPEQADGQPVDARSDLYSLGATIFFAVTGRAPFEAQTAAALLAAHAGDPPPPLATVNPHLPPAFAALVDTCLARSPGDRPVAADDVAAALAGARAASPPIPAPLRRFLADVDAAGVEIGTELLIGASSLGVLFTVFADDVFAAPVFVTMAALMVAKAGSRVGEITFRTRDLQRQGYRHRSLGPAITLHERNQADETSVVAPSAGAKRDLWFTIVTGIVKTIGSAWLMTAELPMLLNILGGVGTVILPAVTLRDAWKYWRRGKASLWNRIVAGPFGRVLFFAGRVMTGFTGRPAISTEPTAVVLGEAIDDLFAALPADERRRLGDVPALVMRLQADVAALNGTDAADGQRRETAVAAMEALRLDLWRLRAGQGSLDDLTRDVDAVRRIGRAVDGLEGRDA